MFAGRSNTLSLQANAVISLKKLRHDGHYQTETERSPIFFGPVSLLAQYYLFNSRTPQYPNLNVFEQDAEHQ